MSHSLETSQGKEEKRDTTPRLYFTISRRVNFSRLVARIIVANNEEIVFFGLKEIKTKRREALSFVSSDSVLRYPINRDFATKNMLLSREKEKERECVCVWVWVCEIKVLEK